jgi:hypothetical protein
VGDNRGLSRILSERCRGAAPPASPTNGARRLRWSVLSAACVVLVVGASYWRLRYGVDFTDEAYYVAVPYRFVLGARPFVDETTTAQQTAGLLVYPLVAAYHAAFGLDAIVLFGRQLHLLFSAGVAACVFLGVRAFVATTADALIPALLAIAFVPFGLPDISYDTLGSGFFLAGSLLGIGYLAARQRRWLVAAGFLHGLAIFAYPTFAVPALVYLALLARVSTGRGEAVVPAFAGAAAVPVASLAAVIAQAGVGRVRTEYSQAMTFGGQGGGVRKAVTVVEDLAQTVVHAPLGLAALALVVAYWRRRPVVAVWLLPLLPMLLVPWGDIHGSAGALDYMTIYGAVGLALFLLVGRETRLRTGFLVAFPPALVGGLATSWTSNNGAIVFGLGFAPAAVLTSLLLAAAWSRARDSAYGEGAPEASSFVTGGVALMVLLALQFTYVYRDASVRRLGSEIHGGPYAGLYTTRGRKQFVAALTTDLLRFSPPGCRILFYDNFPAGYLLSRSKPDTNAVFTLSVAPNKIPAYRQVLLRYYDAHGGLPDVVVRLTEIPGEGRGPRSSYDPGDPLDRLVERGGTFRLAVRRPSYAIYRRRSGARADGCVSP